MNSPALLVILVMILVYEYSEIAVKSYRFSNWSSGSPCTRLSSKTLHRKQTNTHHVTIAMELSRGLQDHQVVQLFPQAQEIPESKTEYNFNSIVHNNL